MNLLRLTGIAILKMTALVSLAESATLGYHQIRTDAEGHILPWYSAELSKAYDHNLRLVWSFWKGMEDCPNGVHR